MTRAAQRASGARRRSDEARRDAAREEGPEQAREKKPPARDLAVPAKVRAAKTFGVESLREEIGERRGHGLSEEQRERHSRAGVRVDHARGVADAEDVPRERAVRAQVTPARKEGRGPSAGTSPSRSAASARLSPHSRSSSESKSWCADCATRECCERGEVDATSFDPREPHISPFEEMQNGTAREVLTSSREHLSESEQGRFSSNERAAEASVQRAVASPRAHGRARAQLPIEAPEAKALPEVSFDGEDGGAESHFGARALGGVRGHEGRGGSARSTGRAPEAPPRPRCRRARRAQIA